MKTRKSSILLLVIITVIVLGLGGYFFTNLSKTEPATKTTGNNWEIYKNTGKFAV